MIFVGIFLSHSTKKIHSGTLLCLINFVVSKQLMDKGGGGITILRQKCIVSQHQKKS